MAGAQEPALRQIRELQHQLADRLAALDAQTAARHRQVHWLLEEQGRVLDDLLAEQTAPAVKPPRGTKAA